MVSGLRFRCWELQAFRGLRHEGLGVGGLRVGVFGGRLRCRVARFRLYNSAPPKSWNANAQSSSAKRPVQAAN